MKTLKDLINDWLLTKENEHTASIKHSCKRHDIIFASTELKMERASVTMSNMCHDDIEAMSGFYDAQIDKCNSELYWLDVLYDLNIGR